MRSETDKHVPASGRENRPFLSRQGPLGGDCERTNNNIWNKGRRFQRVFGIMIGGMKFEYYPTTCRPPKMGLTEVEIKTFVDRDLERGASANGMPISCAL